MIVNGNTEGLKKGIVEALEAIYELEVSTEKLWNKSKHCINLHMLISNKISLINAFQISIKTIK